MRPNWLANVNAAKAAGVLLVPTLAVTAKAQMPPSLTGGPRGAMYTQGAGRERTLIPGACLRIQTVEDREPAVEVRTDEAGRFSSAGSAPGSYRITVEFDDMQAGKVGVVPQAGTDTDVAIEPKLTSVKEAIAVSAQAETADASETDSRAILQESTPKHASKGTGG